MLVWNTLFRRWISSKTQENKNRKHPPKKFLSGLVTKLENLLVFVKILWKISSHRWFKKKLLTDLILARTSKVCCYTHAVQYLVQGLFDEAATDGDISQLRRWVVAGQGAATGGRRLGREGRGERISILYTANDNLRPGGWSTLM